jgi:uncharacterized protein (TIGR02147 family)
MHVAKKLNLSPAETNYLLLLVQKDTTKDENLKQDFLVALSNKKRESLRVQLDKESLDEFTDWFYFALIALIRTVGFQSNPAWIAKRLNISAKQVVEALAKLRKKKLVEVSAAEEITLPQSIKLLCEGDYAKRFSMQTLRQLENPQSEITGLSVVVNPKDLPRAKQLITEFMQSFSDEIDGLDGTEVFQLNLHLYPLSQKDS